MGWKGRISVYKKRFMVKIYGREMIDGSVRELELLGSISKSTV